MVEEKDYLEYIEKLKGRIFKILPMYEKNVSTLQSYIASLVFELDGVKEITSNYDGAWLVQTKGILTKLVGETRKENNVNLVRSKVLGLVNTDFALRGTHTEKVNADV